MQHGETGRRVRLSSSCPHGFALSPMKRDTLRSTLELLAWRGRATTCRVGVSTLVLKHSSFVDFTATAAPTRASGRNSAAGVSGEGRLFSVTCCISPLSSGFGTNKTAKAKFWTCLEPFFRQTSGKLCQLLPSRSAAEHELLSN